MGADYLIVGLGNPGPEYEKSPHNAGFAVARSVRALSGGPHFSSQGRALVSRCRWRGRTLLVVLPQSFMNRSGSVVGPMVAKLGIPLQRLVVCYDDLDLPFGVARMREKGGAGGHHGMESIIAAIGSHDFPRVRVGIGSGVDKDENVDYLLTPLISDRWTLIRDAADRAAHALLDAAGGGWGRAMSAFNRAERLRLEDPE
jgi:peptidyl-tRNA hydrolase, PTH1 family